MCSLVCSLLCSCGSKQHEPFEPTLRLATSYSVEESGLFAELSPIFTEATGFRLTPAFVGTGKALDQARQGQADVVWVHSRPQEDSFVAEGYGVNRTEIMASEYVLLGPETDPAGVFGMKSAVEALDRIRQRGSSFVSRGDGSGAHTRERALWQLANIDPSAGPYLSLNGGMAEVLKKASELGAYAISDHPTFLTQQEGLKLKVCVRGDARLMNPYSTIAVNPAKLTNSNFAGAMALIDFLTSERTQRRIGSFGKARYGISFFQPLALPEAGP